MQEHHISVTRTARYYTLGDPHAPVREVWFVCHGYGQLAARYMRAFDALDDGTRLIVAPEALSRFYLEPALGSTHAASRVGATWMTREDRLSEINDYVNYLDAVYGDVFENADRAAVRVHVLGFSQGAATASRWVTQGAAKADQLILWGGLLPPDLPAESHAGLRALRVSIVLGDRDQTADLARLSDQEAWLKEQGVPYRVIRFGGGHQMDSAVLASLAG